MSLTGLTLAGRYCIEHRVGEGGMAHVYFGRDLEAGGLEGKVVLYPDLPSRRDRMPL